MAPWLRTELAHLAPLPGYTRFEGTPTRQEVARQAAYKLDANENLLLPRELVTRLLHEVAEELDMRLYPGPEVEELRTALARHLHVPVDSVLLGSGSSQPLDLLTVTFLRRGSRAVSVSPTFSVYEVRTRLARAEFVAVPLHADFTLNLDALVAAARQARVVFLSSPNNPTGNQFSLDAVKTLCEATPGLVVLDEAYVDFAACDGLPLLGRYPNLVILRTFSKALGIANLRLGYMLADPSLARPFREKIQYPYAVSGLAARLATKLLARPTALRRVIDAVKAERRRLVTALRAIRGVRVFPSDANFVFIAVGAKLDRLYRRCLADGILIRRFGDVQQQRGCARISVGGARANRRLVGIVAKIVGGR
jgi:histidinol-phosphate aminotransferase